jgi:hypothetical protein
MNQQPVIINQLYPNLSEEEIKAAEDNLEQYLTLVVRIYQSQQFEQ